MVLDFAACAISSGQLLQSDPLDKEIGRGCTFFRHCEKEEDGGWWMGEWWEEGRGRKVMVLKLWNFCGA